MKVLLCAAALICSAEGEPPAEVSCPAAEVKKHFYAGMRIETVATPYLERGVLHKGTGETPSGPEVFYLGCTAGKVFPLGVGSEDAFNQWLSAAGTHSKLGSQRVLLVRHYVEIIHGARLLDSFEAFERELSLPRNRRGKHTPAAKRRLERWRTKYGPVMKPPARGTSPVVVYGLAGNRLLRIEITVSASVRAEVEVAERDLPVPMRI